MDKLRSGYRAAIRKLHNDSSHPIWPPGSLRYRNGLEQSRLGDYGDIIDGTFNYVGNLHEKNILTMSDSKTKIGKTTDLWIGNVKRNRIQAGIKVDSFSRPVMGAEIELVLGNVGSVWVSLYNAERDALDNLKGLAEILLTSGDWEESYCVVTSVYRADQVTVIGAMENNSKFRFLGNASDLDALITGDASVKGKIQGETVSGDIFSRQLAQGEYACTVHNMKKTILGKPSVKNTKRGKYILEASNCSGLTGDNIDFEAIEVSDVQFPDN